MAHTPTRLRVAPGMATVTPAAAPAPRFDLPRMFAAIADHNAAFPPAAMFGLAQAGYASLYEQLVSCVLSIRTYDETSYPASVALFARARTPRAMLELDREELVELIHKCTYPGQKADTILSLSRAIVEEYDGVTPATFPQLTAFRGVGPKCANLALGVALAVPAISVDVHVHRVVNRWGLVRTNTPEKTLKALEPIVPRGLWVDVNRVLMPFGKNTCVSTRPKCSTCPVRDDCAQVGVTAHA